VLADILCLERRPLILEAHVHAVAGAVGAVPRGVRAERDIRYGLAVARATQSSVESVFAVTFCPSPLNTPSMNVAVGPMA
jgi:hypothetical protein